MMGFVRMPVGAEDAVRQLASVLESGLDFDEAFKRADVLAHWMSAEELQTMVARPTERQGSRRGRGTLIAGLDDAEVAAIGYLAHECADDLLDVLDVEVFLECAVREYTTPLGVVEASWFTWTHVYLCDILVPLDDRVDLIARIIERLTVDAYGLWSLGQGPYSELWSDGGVARLEQRLGRDHAVLAKVQALSQERKLPGRMVATPDRRSARVGAPLYLRLEGSPTTQTATAMTAPAVP